MKIIDPKPCGFVDWTITVVVLILAVPVLVTSGTLVSILRAYERLLSGKAGESC